MVTSFPHGVAGVRHRGRSSSGSMNVARLTMAHKRQIGEQISVSTGEMSSCAMRLASYRVGKLLRQPKELWFQTCLRVTIHFAETVMPPTAVKLTQWKDGLALDRAALSGREGSRSRSAAAQLSSRLHVMEPGVDI